MGYQRYQRDVYNCIDCGCWIGFGDRYCKSCGARFTQTDTSQMAERATKARQKKAPFHTWQCELIRCSQCRKFVSHRHNYCKHCGVNIPSTSTLSGIGQNLLIPASIFIALIIGFFLLITFY